MSKKQLSQSVIKKIQMTKLLYDLGIDCFRRTENPEKIGAGLILLYLVEEKQLSVEKILQKFNFVRRTIQRDLSKMIALKLIREVAKSKTDPTKYYELL